MSQSPQILRPYQQTAIQSLRESIRAGRKHPILVAATGSGKTTIACEIVRSAVEKRNHVLFLAPRRELIYQASDRFTGAGIAHGIIMAGEDRTVMPNVQVASFDTLHARAVRTRRMRIPRADLVLVDECHLSIAQTRKDIIELYPDAVIIGLTATPARGDGRGLGEIYDDLVMVSSVRELTQTGYLAPARYFAPTTPDLEGIKLNKDGDYQEKQLGKRMDDAKLVGDIIDNWRKIAPGVSTVVFCVTRAHSRHVCEKFREAGVTAEHVDGETPLAERKAIFARVESGETTVLCNVFVATFGLDIPRLTCAVLARPTRNIVLYRQICGRVLRPFPGKEHALIVDHSGAVEQHGFLDDDVPWSLDGNETVAERKKQQAEEHHAPKEITCSQCKTVFKSRRDCPSCGFAMVPPSKPIPTHEADLVEVSPSKANRVATWEEKIAFIGGLKQYAYSTGKKRGWIAHKYRAKFGVWPNDHRLKAAPAIECPPEVRSWITSQNIRYAKSREASA